MDQIAHIFRKDVRQHWAELVLSVGIIVAYAWREVAKFKGLGDTAYNMFLLGMLPLLVVVIWIFLILRVVQAESLVGDRQFWVTRPYDWKKLLAVKLLFVLVFVNVPLFVLQVFLLLKAGFPASHLSGLLWLQLLWSLILMLPVATVATVTRSIGQFMLAILGVLLYFAVLTAALQEFLPPASGVPVEGPIPDGLAGLLVVGAAVTVVLWQYARRRTAQGRVLLLGAAAAVPLIQLATPYRLLIERTYRPATRGQQLPVQLTFDPAKLASREGGRPEKKRVHVRIPLLVSGIEAGLIVNVAGAAVTIAAPEGQQWSSGWYRSDVLLLPRRPHGQEDIAIDRNFFERVKSTPVKVHITFALAPRHAREMVRVVAQAGPFGIPGEGRCSFSPRFQGQILCAFPLKTPALLMSAMSDEITCAPEKNGAVLPSGTTLYGGWPWSRGPGPADFGLNPVQTTSLGFWDWGEARDREHPPKVCPGTPLTFYTNWEDLQPLRTELGIDGIRLVDYQLKDTTVGADGFGIMLP